MYPGRAQIGNHLPVMHLGKKLQDALSQHRTDVSHLEQRVFVGGQQRVEGPEMPRKVRRGGLAHVTDAQRVNEPRQRRDLAFFDRGDDVGRGFVGHPIERGQSGNVELVDIGRRVHQSRVDQLIDQLVTEPLDIQRASTGKVKQSLLALRRAYQAAGTARDRLAGQANYFGAAFRAALGQHELRRIRLPALGQHPHDFGYYVARATNNDRISDAHVLAPHFVFVVQRGANHRHATDEYRLQACHRRQRAGAPHLDVDRQHFGRKLLGRKLVRKREARRP